MRSRSAAKCLDMANADVKACYTCHTACGKEGGRRAAHGAEDACEKKCDEGACMPLRAAGAKRDLPSAETRPSASLFFKCTPRQHADGARRGTWAGP